MKYVDGFVLPIPKKNLGAYQKMARLGAKVWMDHGALEYRECIGDDFTMQGVTPFPKAIKSKSNETVVFAWIVYKSRAHRDRVNAKVMKDPRMNPAEMTEMPFDMKRMMVGGFKVLVER